MSSYKKSLVGVLALEVANVSADAPVGTPGGYVMCEYSDEFCMTEVKCSDAVQTENEAECRQLGDFGDYAKDVRCLDGNDRVRLNYGNKDTTCSGTPFKEVQGTFKWVSNMAGWVEGMSCTKKAGATDVWEARKCVKQGRDAVMWPANQGMYITYKDHKSTDGKCEGETTESNVFVGRTMSKCELTFSGHSRYIEVCDYVTQEKYYYSYWKSDENCENPTLDWKIKMDPTFDADNKCTQRICEKPMYASKPGSEYTKKMYTADDCSGDPLEGEFPGQLKKCEKVGTKYHKESCDTETNMFWTYSYTDEACTKDEALVTPGTWKSPVYPFVYNGNDCQEKMKLTCKGTAAADQLPTGLVKQNEAKVAAAGGAGAASAGHRAEVLSALAAAFAWALL